MLADHQAVQCQIAVDEKEQETQRCVRECVCASAADRPKAVDQGSDDESSWPRLRIGLYLLRVVDNSAT
ncbi:hypothetical protein CDD81_1951 [Ophiocordyceps australis]|uniref:Uncharacterized protein n=1 Tax=Ophiocordyceps australis TaxID=1399860 RepID=A0A2C5X7U6_9HYPO|nr:hypothetical protein CDD81_1951 [Ophiocordyceps australis]